MLSLIAEYTSDLWPNESIWLLPRGDILRKRAIYKMPLAVALIHEANELSGHLLMAICTVKLVQLRKKRKFIEDDIYVNGFDSATFLRLADQLFMFPRKLKDNWHLVKHVNMITTGINNRNHLVNLANAAPGAGRPSLQRPSVAYADRWCVIDVEPILQWVAMEPWSSYFFTMDVYQIVTELLIHGADDIPIPWWCIEN
jgi:hypothetical protein